MLNDTHQKPAMNPNTDALTAPDSSNPLEVIAVDAEHLSKLSSENLFQLLNRSNHGISDLALAVQKAGFWDATNQV